MGGDWRRGMRWVIGRSRIESPWSVAVASGLVPVYLPLNITLCMLREGERGVFGAWEK